MSTSSPVVLVSVFELVVDSVEVLPPSPVIVVSVLVASVAVSPAEPPVEVFEVDPSVVVVPPELVLLSVDVDSVEVGSVFEVHQYTGDPDRSRGTRRRTLDWVREVQDRGAGEVVLNCMASDGVRRGYDLPQLEAVRAVCSVPLVASGGAGTPEHFAAVFERAHVDGALAASVFHSGAIAIGELKKYLRGENVEMRL